MHDIEPDELGIDQALGRALAAPPPRLSPDFDLRVMAEVSHRAGSMGRFGRGLLAGYGALSLATSASVMRAEGLAWTSIGALVLAPLVLTAFAAAVWRAAHAIRRPHRHPR